MAPPKESGMTLELSLSFQSEEKKASIEWAAVLTEMGFSQAEWDDLKNGEKIDELQSYWEAWVMKQVNGNAFIRGV